MLETETVKAVTTVSPELPQNKQDASQQRKFTKNKTKITLRGPGPRTSGTLQGHPEEAGRLERPERHLCANELCWVAVMQIYPYIKPHHNCHFKFVIFCYC